MIENITISQLWQWLLAFAAAVVAFSKAWEVIARRLKPQTDIKETVKQHEKHLKRDLERIEACEDTDRVQCQALLAMLDHMITGNGIDSLKDAKQKLQQHLIDR